MAPLTLAFTARDVAATRFAVSPLWEVVAGVRVLKDPAAHAVHRPWAEWARERLSGVEWGLLSELVPVPTPAIAGFLCPPPSTSAPELEVELGTMLGMAALVRPSLDRCRPAGARVAELRADPGRGLERLAAEIRGFWEAALAPHWPRVRTLLDGDVLHRARLLARGGLAEMFDDLAPNVRWREDTLTIEHRTATGPRPLRGRGLLLVPSAFTWPDVFSVSTAPWQPTLRYPPRGVGTLWEREPRDAPRALAGVLGRTRALLLAELHQPTSTKELARRTGLSEAGANQHLTALRRAGLASGHRAGRHVLYARTAAAEALLAAAASGR
ncbi:DUF5937 family protein [Sphaerisporangium sp. TRM90804]|uniref:DUF5937 family protein n=1 Tax=Sphaerisporangium sp. TRM90804 TaxID=3031113 RepID=UPI002448CA7D|nr:DUF5937 family protein [Sphaerisporangium sp. TRM90804]MDH2425002.1 DUF5937 family protein [Sphaerisporangium sp. TRM90804]